MRVAGFGFRGAATAESLADAYRRVGGAADLFATLDRKAGAEAMQAFARGAGVPLVAVAAADLAGQAVMTQSERIRERFGTGSVAEAAALAAAGTGARLIGPRAISGDGLATAAIAERTDE